MNNQSDSIEEIERLRLELDVAKMRIEQARRERDDALRLAERYRMIAKWRREWKGEPDDYA